MVIKHILVGSASAWLAGGSVIPAFAAPVSPIRPPASTALPVSAMAGSIIKTPAPMLGPTASAPKEDGKAISTLSQAQQLHMVDGPGKDSSPEQSAQEAAGAFDHAIPGSPGGEDDPPGDDGPAAMNKPASKVASVPGIPKFQELRLKILDYALGQRHLRSSLRIAREHLELRDGRIGFVAAPAYPGFHLLYRNMADGIPQQLLAPSRWDHAIESSYSRLPVDNKTLDHTKDLELAKKMERAADKKNKRFDETVDLLLRESTSMRLMLNSLMEFAYYQSDSDASHSLYRQIQEIIWGIADRNIRDVAWIELLLYQVEEPRLMHNNKEIAAYLSNALLRDYAWTYIATSQASLQHFSSALETAGMIKDAGWRQWALYRIASSQNHAGRQLSHQSEDAEKLDPADLHRIFRAAVLANDKPLIQALGAIVPDIMQEDFLSQLPAGCDRAAVGELLTLDSGRL